MPYTINWEHRGIYTVWTGRVTSSEILKFQKEVQGDKRFDDLRFSLHDFLRCQKVDYSEQEMTVAAAMDFAGSYSNPYKIKIAIVAIDPLVKTMIGVYLNAKSSPYPLQFFSSMNDARAWVE